MGRVLGKTFHGVLDQVQPVANGIFQIELMGVLQKPDGDAQNLILRKGQMVAENRHFILARGKAEPERRLQTGEHIVRHFVCRRIRVHRHATAEVLQAVHTHLPKPHDPFLDLVPPAGIKLTPKHYAYLKISEGCNHRCSFCIIPSMRGDLVSRPIGEVLQEAQKLFESGVKELLVVSQDTSAYGVDIQYRTGFWDGKPIKTRLYDLALALHELAISHQAWVRMHYVYPYPHVDQILPIMAQFKNEGFGLLPYLDIPFQHAHPDVLKRMKRPASGEKNLDRIAAWRAICPDLVIRSTFIAGFPGETEEEFSALLQFMEEAQIDRAGCFAYSPVEGATANALDNPVPESIREERRSRFMALAEEQSSRRLGRLVDQRIRVLVDHVTPEGGIGRSAADAPEIDGIVRILPPSKPSKRYRVGEFVKATVLETQGHDLIAEV
ncbi:MAG: 30S ribosomal protein S12 methylthiotransferase RimO [Betaproteobacteria bacterium]|nr:30S ribosomal protein S12 methylthiotransferase RimO [Betaproteobacteria bacterium]